MSTFLLYIQETSQDLWKQLQNKDYSKINDGYFEVSYDKQKYICIFKKVANALYLMVYKYKDNIIYSDQTITIKFNDKGEVFKFNNKPLQTRVMPPYNTLNITEDENNKIQVNGIPIIIDKEYTNKIIKTAKKSMLNFGKIFV